MAIFFSQSRAWKAFLVLLLLQSATIFAKAEDPQGQESEETTQIDNTIMSSPLTVLVVGATGGTGKHVVQQLLDHPMKPTVKVIVRSKQRMLDALTSKDQDYGDRLSINEAVLLDLSDQEIEREMADVEAVVSCLGHTMDFKGIWGHPRKLVTESVQRLSTAMQKTAGKKKFVLMGSDGVAHPAETDDLRTFTERTILAIIRFLIPPHADNEGAAAYLYGLDKEKSNIEWTVVRPTDLIDGDAGQYELYSKPHGSLFGAGVATRVNVAKSMVALLTDEELWEEWKYGMPVIHDAEAVKTSKSEL
jgi:nucleoside-diphosphate-sugar epimerase